MGCCICRPKVEVTEDPTVLFYAKTGRAALISACYSEVLNGIFGGGILYVKNGMLCYETTCGSKLCCKCFKKSWILSSIQSVNFVANDSEIVLAGRTPHVITMNPGLRIRITGRGGVDCTLIAGVPDAANFQQQLNNLISKQRVHTMF